MVKNSSDLAVVPDSSWSVRGRTAYLNLLYWKAHSQYWLVAYLYWSGINARNVDDAVRSAPRNA